MGREVAIREHALMPCLGEFCSEYDVSDLINQHIALAILSLVFRAVMIMTSIHVICCPNKRDERLRECGFNSHNH